MAAEGLARELWESCEQLGLGFKPEAIDGDDLSASVVGADAEGVAPLAAATDVDLGPCGADVNDVS